MVTQSTLARVPCMASSLANWCAQESQLDVDVDVVLVVSFGDGDVEDVDDDVHGADITVCMSSSPSNWSTAAAQTRDLNDGG